MRISVIRALVVMLAGALAIVLALPLLPPRCAAVGGANFVEIPIAQLIRGEGKHFCYHSSTGEKIRFVLAEGADGKTRAAFDACRQCYKFHKGYRLIHGALVCRLCGNRYAIEHMLVGKASCVPVSLPHQEDAGKVRVKVADLERGSELF